MKKFISFSLVIMALVAMAAMVVPTLADDNFKGIIIPSDGVLYHTDGTLNILEPDANGNWASVLNLSDAELEKVAATPAEATLVKSASNISLYKLTSGEWQINTAPDAEGKVHVVVFDSSWGSYHSYDLVNDTVE